MKKNLRKSSKRRIFLDSRGAVSVFLTIILVPCIVVACLFDDVSRVHLCKAHAESAADLALHSLLSNYDNSLKEYYGLVASCQNIEDFYDVSETYFKGMMAAEGISGEDSDLFVDYIRELRSGSVSDFLQADIMEDLQIDESPNSKLGENPALLEDEIVEFMKYRGPIQIVDKLIDRFKSLDLEKELTDAEINEPIIEAKQEFAKNETELLKDAFHTYLAIKQYDDAQQNTKVPSEEKYKEVEKDQQNVSDDLREVTRLITLYYAATEGIYLIDFPSMGMNTYTSQIKKNNVGYKAAEGDDYFISKSTVDSIIDEIEDDLPGYINRIKTAGDNVGNSCINIAYTEGTTNPAIYCMKMQEAVSQSELGTIRQNGEKMLKLYAKIKAALECGEDPEAEDELPDGWRSKLNSARDSIDRTQSAYLDDDLEGNGNYSIIRRRYYFEANASKVVQDVKGRAYTFDSKYCGSKVTIGTFISKYNSSYQSLKKTLEERKKQLTVAIDGGPLKFGSHTYWVKSLDTLEEEAQKTGDSLESWNSKAKAGGTKYADEDVEESNKKLGIYESEDGSSTSSSGKNDVDTYSEKMAKHINAESVRELKERLSNIRTDIDNCLKAIKEMKYGNSALSELQNAEGLITAATRSVVPRSGISINLREGESAASKYADQLIKPGKEELFKAPTMSPNKNGNDPDLTQSHNKMPVLYEYLRNQFLGKEQETDDNVNKAEDKQKEWEKKGKEAKKANDEYEQYTEGRGSGISGGHGGSEFHEGTFLTSLLGIATKLAKGDVASFRDELYVVEYIMDMFSWSSFNNEGKYKLLKNVHANSDYPYTCEQWEKEDVTDVYENQSLTNLHFNNTNNKAFLGEVEYVLYGQKSWEGNVKKAYKNIYEIRYLLNLTSGFMNFYGTGTDTGKAINGVANTVAALTQGIIPPVLTKCLLIGMIAVLESCKDLEVLKKGAPVTVFKIKEEQWYWNRGVSDDPMDVSFDDYADKVQPEDPNGMYYSDYMYVFLILQATSGGGAYKNLLLRTGDLVEANMRLKDGKFDLSKSRCYFRLKNTVQVKPLMLELPIVDSLSGVHAKEFRESINWRQFTIDVIRGYS